MVRKHLYIKYIGIIVAVLGHLSPVDAQISQGGRPYSFSSTVTDSIRARTMAALDVAALVAEVSWKQPRTYRSHSVSAMPSK